MSDEEVKGKLIGKVIHYFDKIQVAVVELSGEMKDGELIRFVSEDTDFEQTVESMEVEHKKIKKAKKQKLQ